eukprot:scaffold2249_cov272-Pinguiococcus_pyrenoidosus.AAC.3
MGRVAFGEGIAAHHASAEQMQYRCKTGAKQDSINTTHVINLINLIGYQKEEARVFFWIC